MSIPRSTDNLVSAIKLEDFELAEEVLRYYFFPFDGADSQGERPLVVAVEKAIQGIPHAHQLVDYLLRNGTNPNVKDFEGISPWLAAVGNAIITDLLLQHGAQADELRPETLVSAVVGQKKKLVSLLMRAGCDVNLVDQDGMLPLVAALPSIEMVTTILDMANEINQGGAVSWTSKRQTAVTLSSAEAEYVAVALATKEGMWLQMLLAELAMVPKPPLKIYCDNLSCIYLASNLKHSEKTKHVDMKFHFIREMVESKKLQLEHTSTNTMWADFLTKPLSAEKHALCSFKLGLVRLSESQSH